MIGGELLEAWFTTYDQPDASLLVEHLLPSLLGLDKALTPDAQDRNYYFGELSTALERLRGRLSIISSLPRNRRFKNDGEEHTQDDNAGPQSAPYPWLWRYVSHFTVGANGPAVQHSKLWAFHWQNKEGEFLELHVSSTNLTASAFKDQIQAGWSSRVELKEKPTKAALKGWGDLISFLDALGDSAGQNAKERITRLVQLLGRARLVQPLGRANCPKKNVIFVASTPKSGKRGTHGIRNLKPAAIHILVPTIGDWDNDSLSAWGKDVGVPPDKIHLKWIDENHPWACGWTLTGRTERVLRESVQLNHMKADDRFHDEHMAGDTRWSHAKLYLIRLANEKKRRLLLTSANWSVSAWGAGKDDPRNFELGVLFETDWKWPEEGIKEKLSAPFTTVRDSTGESRLQWAEASWDGTHITLSARSTDNIAPISVVLTFTESTEGSISLVKGEASMAWNDVGRTPLAALFTQGDEAIKVEVLDLRPPDEFAKTPLPEVDPAAEKALREAFILQRYGGPAVDTGPGPGGRRSKRSASAKGPAADYSVKAWLDARAAFDVVDTWSAALDKKRTDPVVREQVLLDGRQLHDIYAGRGDVASLLVAEELKWRLQKEAG